MISPARIATVLPTAGPITRLQTLSVTAASGTVTANVAAGISTCSARTRRKSIRRKKIHVGACSAKAVGR